MIFGGALRLRNTLPTGGRHNAGGSRHHDMVSADRLTDKRGGNPYSYYTALVTVDQSDH